MALQTRDVVHVYVQSLRNPKHKYCVLVCIEPKPLFFYYAIDLDRNRRARAKQRGGGCAYLLLHEVSPAALLWVLLVTAGDHPAHKLEQLRDALNPTQRLELFGYEFVRMTKAGAPSGLDLAHVCRDIRGAPRPRDRYRTTRRHSHRSTAHRVAAPLGWLLRGALPGRARGRAPQGRMAPAARRRATAASAEDDACGSSPCCYPCGSQNSDCMRPEQTGRRLTLRH